jgi:DNA-directed RNA polymerase subunit RPC12/RpoP
MIQENSAGAGLECICPECKNTINLSRYPNLIVGMVIECDHCGMTLLVKEIKGASVLTEIVDEGK